MDTTFPRLVLEHAAQRPHAAAMREKEYGIWQTYSWSGMAKLVEHVACGLHEAGRDPSGFDVLESPLLVVAIILSVAMATLGLRHARD